MAQPEHSPSAESMLERSSAWLERNLNLAPEAVSRVERRADGKQASAYSDVFARMYNNLVGLHHKDSIPKLFEGSDPRNNGLFLASICKSNDCRKVIDTCAGCFYDSIYLLGAASRGEITLERLVANEVDPAYWSVAEQNMQSVRDAGHAFPVPETPHALWQDLRADFGDAQFDLCLCMGNSISHLSDQAQRRICFANFASILDTNGVCVVDTRNFDRILANADELRGVSQSMMDRGEFMGGNKTLFPGTVANFPVSIGPEHLIFAYVDQGQTQPYSLVEFSPLKLQSLTDELLQFFGSVEVRYDRVNRALAPGELERMDGPATIQCICTQPKYAEALQLLS